MRGDVYAFNQLIRPYLNFVLEYLASSGFSEPAERKAQALGVFAALWERLGYAKRVSDFEFLLGRLLLHHGGAPPSFFGNDLESKLRRLSPEERFAVIAREMEDWQPYWIALCTRKNVDEIREMLREVRCRLVGRTLLEPLTADAEKSIRKVSFCLDEDPGNRNRLRLARELEAIPEGRKFKAAWLATRGELINLRQDWRLDDAEEQQLQRELGSRLRFIEIAHPSLPQRLSNIFSFSRYPEYHRS